MQNGTVSNDERRVHVGCSGWVYKHWRGVFYPEGLPQKRWFKRYSEKFDTVEINASFYRLPLASTFDGWRDKAPKGFRYAVKASRFVTHMKKLVGCNEEVARFIALARKLEHARGPILYQLPPSLQKDLPRLEAFLSRLPADLEHVVEFRHKSWYDEQVLALLDRHGAGFVSHDMKGLSRRAGRAAAPPTSAFTVPAANIGAATRMKPCSTGPTGSSISGAKGAAPGAISTTTSTATPSTTREHSSRWCGRWAGD